MKKFRSILAIILVLSCLLSLLVGCNKTPVDDDEEPTAPKNEENNRDDYPMTEKDKENIFITAMAYLTTKNFQAAYDELMKIPDYVSEGNESVATYLARFGYKYSTIFMFEDDNPDYTFWHMYGYDDFGYHTSYVLRNAAHADVTDEKTVVSQIYEDGVLMAQRMKKVYISYVYDTDGKLSAINEHEGIADTSRIKYTTQYNYDTNGNLINKTKTQFSNGAFVAEVFSIDYTYNDKNQLVMTTEVQDPVRTYGKGTTATETTTINTTYTTVTQTTADKATIVTNYEYNEAGQLVKMSGNEAIHKDVTPSVGTSVPAEYVLHLIDYVSTYQYNAKGQLAKETKTYSGAVAEDRVTIKRLDGKAFQDRKLLETISLPYTLIEIAESSFRNCENLKSIIIPPQVTTIGANAFTKCKSLETVIIPSLVTIIEKETFMDCSSLKSITIPNGVTKIGENAFSGCTALTDIYFVGDETEWNNITKNKANIPSTVEVHFIDPSEVPQAPAQTPDAALPTRGLKYVFKADGTYAVTVGTASTNAKHIHVPTTAPRAISFVNDSITYTYDDLDRLISVEHLLTDAKYPLKRELYSYEAYTLYYDPYK